MQVSITTRHADIDESVKNYIIQKLSKLERYSNKIIEVKVILDIQGIRNIAELVLVMKGKSMAIEEEGGGLNEAFDIALDKMQKRLRRYSSKKKNHNK